MSKPSEQNVDIDFNINFGDDYEEKPIVHIEAEGYLGQESPNLEEIIGRHAEGIQKNIERDIFILIRFFVQPGRENDAAQYLQKGMDNYNEDSNTLNPIQCMIVDPKDAGKVYFDQKNGQVIIRYQIYQETVTDDFEDLVQHIKEFSNNNDANLKFDILFKGESITKNQDKVDILANYTEFNFKIENLKRDKTFTFFESFDIDDQIKDFSLYQMIKKGLRRIKLKFVMNPFLKLR